MRRCCEQVGTSHSLAVRLSDTTEKLAWFFERPSLHPSVAIHRRLIELHFMITLVLGHRVSLRVKAVRHSAVSRSRVASSRSAIILAVVTFHMLGVCISWVKSMTRPHPRFFLAYGLSHVGCDLLVEIIWTACCNNIHSIILTVTSDDVRLKEGHYSPVDALYKVERPSKRTSMNPQIYSVLAAQLQQVRGAHYYL